MTYGLTIFYVYFNMLYMNLGPVIGRRLEASINN